MLARWRWKVDEGWVGQQLNPKDGSSRSSSPSEPDPGPALSRNDLFQPLIFNSTSGAAPVSGGVWVRVWGWEGSAPHIRYPYWLSTRACGGVHGKGAASHNRCSASVSAGYRELFPSRFIRILLLFCSGTWRMKAKVGHVYVKRIKRGYTRLLLKSFLNFFMTLPFKSHQVCS